MTRLFVSSYSVECGGTADASTCHKVGSDGAFCEFLIPGAHEPVCALAVMKWIAQNITMGNFDREELEGHSGEDRLKAAAVLLTGNTLFHRSGDTHIEDCVSCRQGVTSSGNARVQIQWAQMQAITREGAPKKK